MPIANLTDIPRTVLKLGQIRKGEPKGDNVPGKDLDYFRVTFLKNIRVLGGKTVNIGEKLEARFREVYGEKPTALNVRIPDQDVGAVWDANYECYKQGGLYASAGSRKVGDDIRLYWIFYRDLETAEVHITHERAVTPKGFELMQKPLDLNQPIYKNSKGEPFYLKPVGRLKVVIQELSDIAVGYFEFRPESPRDIRNISAELSYYDTMARSVGKTINGVPCVLCRREEIVPKKIKGKLTSGASWVVHLDVGGEWGARALDVIERLALPEIVEGEVSDIPQLESETEAPEPQPEDPEAVYQRATEIVIRSKNKERFLGELNMEQLTWVAENSKNPSAVVAANIILKHDFSAETIT